MKVIIFVTSLLLVLNLSMAKETVLYKAEGVQLIDLIRGIPPKEGALKLTEVEGDSINLPDGIYYQPPEGHRTTYPDFNSNDNEQPEDKAVVGHGDSKYLYLNNNNGKPEHSNSIKTPTR